MKGGGVSLLPVPVGICIRPKPGTAGSGKERGTGVMQGGGALLLPVPSGICTIREKSGQRAGKQR